MKRARDILLSSLAAARKEVVLLAVLALFAAGLWAFIGIAEEVSEGDFHVIDKHILLALRAPGDVTDPIGPAWLEELGRDVTALGSMGILSFITVASGIFLALLRRYRSALFVVGAIAAGQALSFALKAGFDRPRPDLVPHGAVVYTASFPSGHSMMAAVTYLTLGALFVRFLPQRRLQVYVLALAILITVCVGLSRIYLGVHWPSDVLAGWAAGATWAMISWAAALWMQRRRTIETPGSPPD